jgi:CRP/FNR family transcriptional regulator, nitrogen fixation regulation protein
MTAHMTINEANAVRTNILAAMDSAEPMRAAGSVIHVPESQSVFEEGDSADTFYQVVSGVVRVCRFLSDGRRQIESFHVAGEVFGFELGHERQLSAEAIDDCTLIAYRRRNVEALAQKDAAVSRNLYCYAMENLSQAQAHSLLLGRRGAVEKVAAFLLTWARHGNARLVHLAMTRQDIADYLGLTIESVSRSLSQMERDGVIALPGIREVRLNNMTALADLAA